MNPERSYAMKYFVTTGTSLTESSRCWYSENEINTAPARRSVRSYDDKTLEDLLESGNLSVLKQLRERRVHVSERAAIPTWDPGNSTPYHSNADGVVARYFDPECWNLNRRRSLPAELATLVTMTTLSIIGPGDEIVLLMGETNRPEAALCAAILRQMSGSGHFPTSKISVADVGNWDPLNAGFDGVMEKLWRSEFSNGTHLTSPQPRASFVLTGGYKAVVIDLAVRLGKYSSTTSIYFLHEKADINQVRHGLITIPIEGGDPRAYRD